MATRIYGASDDLIDFEGDFKGEVGCWRADEETKAVLIVVSDGTVLKVWYGDRGIWRVQLERKGGLFERIDPCTDEDADPHSDVAHFREGVAWAYAATAWEKVR